jgi:S-DNA-T family DNA segregation ATPase FtsK/SpoIIIE
MATTQRPPAARGKAKAQPRSRTGPPLGLTLDRQLDLLGLALLALALIAILSALSPQRGWLSEMLLGLLQRAFGWGAYVAPFGLGAAGLWLLLRHFGDRLPRIHPQRPIGLVLTYLVALATLTAIGEDGGAVGAWLYASITASGTAATALILIAGWLLGLALLVRLSPRPAARHAWQIMSALMQAALQWWQTRSQRKKTGPTPAPAVPAMAAVESRPAGALSGPAARTRQQGMVRVEAPPVSSLLPDIDEVLDALPEGAVDAETNWYRARIIEETLAAFGVPVDIPGFNTGPAVTQFKVVPGFYETASGKRTKVKVAKIAALADDLALALAAPSIRIVTPVPGQDYVGIEVPNAEVSVVSLRRVITSPQFQALRSPLRIALGQDVSGTPVAADLARMPHLLIAGATGSGKSVCVNAIITCLLLHNTPQDLRLVLVDPKRVELAHYNGIPHLVGPVVVDLERVAGALQWITREMDRRYHKFAEVGARHIEDYNRIATAAGGEKLPYLVLIIDELADLMMLAPEDMERTICRLAQMARATGIHLIIATQRPSVDVVTGLIKANFPARIAFAVASSIDSRVILDTVGAERLLGRGDMLFVSPEASQPQRLQGCFVSDKEISRLVRFWKGVAMPVRSAPANPVGPGTQPLLPEIGREGSRVSPWDDLAGDRVDEAEDALLEEAIRIVREANRASVSLLQRRLRIGYTRAARLMDALEARGIIGPAQGSAPREVLSSTSFDSSAEQNADGNFPPP